VEISRGGSDPSDSPTLVDHTHDLGPDSPTMVDSSPVPGRPLPPIPRRQSSPSMLQPGALLGQRYEILQILGEGGMGAVYKARDRELNRMVALKVIRPDLAGSQVIIDRFKQELLLSTQVTHKNVVRIYDLNEAEGMKFITMEYVEGEDLRALMKQKKLSPAEAVEIMQQVCRALEAAHSVGIIHRDLKPQNVMRDKSGRILVMDFGLARTLEGDGMTQTGALVGTMDYMSPEQALGKDLDQRSDLFALGLIFYELLTGKMPYKADSVVASLLKRTQERAAPVSSHDGSIPKQLSDIVSHCMEPDVKLRYQTAAQILADLDAWQGGHAAATLHFPSGVRPWGRSYPWHWFGAAAAVVILAIVGFLFRGKLFGPTAKQMSTGPVVSLAILPFRNASGDASLNWLGPSLADMLSTDVGQSTQLRTVSPDRLHQVLADLQITPATAIDPTMLRRVADSTSADTVVWGQYAKFGDQIRVDASLQDLKHDRRVPLKIDAAGEKDIPGAVDRLADAIRKNLAVSSDVIKELQASSFQPTSNSMVALRAYNHGLELLRAGKNLEALKEFQSATKEDTSFALAFSKLAQVYANLGYNTDAEAASRKAVDLSHNLPARAQYLIAANHARVIKDYSKAIESYEQLAKVAPNDPDAQFALAGVYEETNAFDKARQHCGKVLEIDPQSGEALLAMARIEMRSENPQASLEYLNRALTLAIKLENAEEEAMVRQSMGVAYFELNKPEEALRNYQQSLAIKRRLGQKRGIADSLEAIGQLQAAIGKFDLALNGYKQGLQLRREIGDKSGIGEALIDLSLFYSERGQNDEALKLLKEALQIQREVGNQKYVALCLNAIGSAYFAKGSYEDARTYFEQALQLREKLNLPTDIADTLHNLAENSSNVGDYGQAVAYYLRALELRRSSNDKRGAAIELYSLGRVFEYQGRYGAALNSEQVALKTFRELQDHSLWMGYISSGYGGAFVQMGRDGEAQKEFSEAIQLARQFKNESLIAQTLDLQGDGFFYRGDFKAAEKLYRQALEAASHSSDRGQVLLSKISVSKVAVEQRPSREAIRNLTRLAEEADTLGLKYSAAECSTYVAEAFIKTKNFSQARLELERALGNAERLGLRTLLAKDHYLLASALRLSGNDADAAGHYREALQILEDIGKEAASDKLMERVDLKSIYTDSSRWARPGS
jgi:tetratricopeptide (TPR) repeat protein/predicted Ser/Thr protein kinase